jgi:hypothetical protein
MYLHNVYHGGCLSHHDLHKSGNAWYIPNSFTIHLSSRLFHFLFVVTSVLLCETVWAFMLLQWCCWCLGCGGKSLSYWCPLFWDSVVVSSSGAKLSMQNSSYFSMNILTRADETTMLPQNVRLKPSNDTAPLPQTAETSVGGLLISHNHLFFVLIKWPYSFGSQSAHCSSITHTSKWVSNSDRTIPVIWWQNNL